MSLVLNIDTALDLASICLAHDGKELLSAVNENPQDHAGWLHKAILRTMDKSGYSLSKLEAVAVSIGPGSYTGLRVGLASAKGLCYAMNIPLITVNSLEMLAFSVKEKAPDLICPMIDARRMEVFTAVYNNLLIEEISPHAVIIDEKSFQSLLLSHKILFCGNGSKKLQSLITSGNAYFSDRYATASDLALLSHNRFHNKEFANLAYTEPLYLKEFYSGLQKN